jgi:hypothetical protein
MAGEWQNGAETGAETGSQERSQDTVEKWLEGIRLGRAKRCGGVVLVPLLKGDRSVDASETTRGGTGYRTMPEAMARGDLLVMEVSSIGMPGEVLAWNRGDVPVLMLEGEEWSGARQNRVLMASVLLRPGPPQHLPVACSEPGRWNYPGKGAGPAMGESGSCLPPGMRAAARMARTLSGEWTSEAAKAVGEVVRQGLLEWRTQVGGGETLSDWQDRDVRRWEGLEEVFRWVPGQVGWMAHVHGVWQSVELVSRPAAWRRWHDKWLRGVLSGTEPRGAHDRPGAGSPDDAGWRKSARLALLELTQGSRARSPGIDLGEREERRSAHWTGATLILDGELLHGGWQRIPSGARHDPCRVQPAQRMGMTSMPR